MIAHHYCSHINEDVRQCVIYDSDKKDAREQSPCRMSSLISITTRHGAMLCLP